MSTKKIAHPARRAKKAALLADELSQHMAHLAEREAAAKLAFACKCAEEELCEVIERIHEARDHADDLWFNVEDLAAGAVRSEVSYTGGNAIYPAEKNIARGREGMFKLVQALRWATRSVEAAALAIKDARTGA